MDRSILDEAHLPDVRELTEEELAAVAGGNSGYLIGGGRTDQRG